MDVKIVHVVEPLAGGIVTFLKSLVENLSSDSHIIVHGERVDVMPFTEVRRQFRHTNVRFIRWRSAQRSLRPVKDFRAFLELYTILRRLQQKKLVDAVHLHSSKSGFIGRLVCRVLNIQNVVYTPNGAPFMAGGSKASNYLYRQLEKLGSSFGGRIVCCSPSEQLAYEEAGMPAITINNGIAVAEPGLPAPDAGHKTRFRVVTSGRILSQKNPGLFNAIAGYFEEFPQFEFVWIGGGADAHLLTATNIKITGWLSPAEAKALLLTSDIYLSTAKFEGLSFSVLEALSLQKPVLLTDCIGNRDMVIQGLNGDLFTTSQQAILKIVQYFNNRYMLPVMGGHSAFHCEDAFDILQTKDRYRNLYSRGKQFSIDREIILS